MAIAVTDRIRRGEGGVSPFAVAWQDDLKIAFVTVADITARDAIYEWKRLPYMTVYVVATNTEYTLGTDLTIAGQVWTEKSYGVPANVVTEDEIFDSEGYIQPQLIKNIFLNTSYVVADEAAMLALTTYTGNFVIRTDTSEVYIKLNNDNPADISDFALASGGSGVISVNGGTGVVSVTIASLLAVGANQTAFDAAVTVSPTVAANVGAILTLQGDLITLQGDLADLDDYVQTHLGIQTLSSIAHTPTAPDIGKSLIWDGTNYTLSLISGGGGLGDMLLAGVQTNTAAKTFLDNTFYMRNVANSFNSTFTNTNTAARTYTLPNITGNVLVTGGTNVLSGNTLINPSTYNFEVATSTGLTGFISNADKFRANKVIAAYSPLFATGFTLSVNVSSSAGGSVTWTTTNIPTGGVTIYCGTLEYNAGDPLWILYDEFTVNIPDGSPLVIPGFDNFGQFYASGSTDKFFIIVPNDTDTYPYISYNNLTIDLVDTGSYNITESAALSSDEKLTLTNQDGYEQGWDELLVPLYGINYYYELIGSGHSFVGPSTFAGNIGITGDVYANSSSFTIKNVADDFTLLSVSEGAAAGFVLSASGISGGVTSSIVGQTTGTLVGDLTIQAGIVGDSVVLNLGAKGNITIDAQYDSLFSVAGNVILKASGGGYTEVQSAFKVSGVGSTEGTIPVIDASGNFSGIGIGTDTHVLTMVAGLPAWAAYTPGSGGGDVSKVGTPADNQIGVWTGDGTIEGTSGLTYSGSNLQLTGDIGSTGTRITKGWFTDLQVTNAIAGSITGNAATVTTNANLTGDVTSSGNATTIAAGAVDIAMLSATGTPSSSTYLRGDNTWAAVSGGGGITNGAANTELMKSDGTNAVASGLFSTTAGNVTLGTSLAGAYRDITADGSATDVGLYFVTKGGGLINFAAPTVVESSDVLGGILTSMDEGAGPSISPFYTSTKTQGGAFIIQGAEGTAAGTLTGQSVTISGGNGWTSGNNAAGGVNIYGGTPNGSGAVGPISIGLSTDKLAFFAATPVVKQSSVTTSQGIADVLTAYGLLPSSTISGGGGGDMLLGTSQTVTALKTFNTGTFALRNPANTFSYNFLGSAIVANRDVTIPLLTGNDTFVMAAFSQVLTNKGIDLANNTLATTKAQLIAAVSDDEPLFAGDLGAGLAIQSGLLISKNVVYAPTITANAYTLQASDNKKTLHIDNGATAVTVNLPDGMVDDFSCDIINKGTGVLTLVAASTLESTGDTIEQQNTGATVYHDTGDVWTAVGSLGTPVVIEKTLTFVIQSSSVITTGGKAFTMVTAPFTGTIKRWKLSADIASNITMDLWKAAGAVPTNSDSITASAKPSLSSAQLNASSTLTSWDIDVTEGDVLIAEVEANNNALYINLEVVVEVA